jgi:hypothetical protein
MSFDSSGNFLGSAFSKNPGLFANFEFHCAGPKSANSTGPSAYAY